MRRGGSTRATACHARTNSQPRPPGIHFVAAPPPPTPLPAVAMLSKPAPAACRACNTHPAVLAGGECNACFGVHPRPPLPCGTRESGCFECERLLPPRINPSGRQPYGGSFGSIYKLESNELLKITWTGKEAAEPRVSANANALTEALVALRAGVAEIGPRVSSARVGMLRDSHTYPVVAIVMEGGQMTLQGAVAARVRGWVTMVEKAAEALLNLHALGFVHGDAKPANAVVMGDNHIRLIDFGASVPLTKFVYGKHAVMSSDNLLPDADVAKRAEMRKRIEDATTSFAAGKWNADVQNHIIAAANEVHLYLRFPKQRANSLDDITQRALHDLPSTHLNMTYTQFAATELGGLLVAALHPWRALGSRSFAKTFTAAADLTYPWDAEKPFTSEVAAWTRWHAVRRGIASVRTPREVFERYAKNMNHIFETMEGHKAFAKWNMVFKLPRKAVDHAEDLAEEERVWPVVVQMVADVASMWATTLHAAMVAGSGDKQMKDSINTAMDDGTAETTCVAFSERVAKIMLTPFPNPPTIGPPPPPPSSPSSPQSMSMPRGTGKRGGGGPPSGAPAAKRQRLELPSTERLSGSTEELS